MDGANIGSHVDEQIRVAADTKRDESLEQRKAVALSNVEMQGRVQQQIGEKGLNLIDVLSKSASIGDLRRNVNEISRLAEGKAKLGSHGALLLLDYSIDVVNDLADNPAFAEWKEEHETTKKQMEELREKLRAQLQRSRE